jgi:hypothetical protein
VLFLASDRSSYLTGATIAADAGRTAVWPAPDRHEWAYSRSFLVLAHKLAPFYRHGRDAACHWLSTRPEPGAAAVTCQSVQLFLG